MRQSIGAFSVLLEIAHLLFAPVYTPQGTRRLVEPMAQKGDGYLQWGTRSCYCLHRLPVEEEKPFSITTGK